MKVKLQSRQTRRNETDTMHQALLIHSNKVESGNYVHRKQKIKKDIVRSLCACNIWILLLYLSTEWMLLVFNAHKPMCKRFFVGQPKMVPNGGRGRGLTGGIFLFARGRRRCSMPSGYSDYRGVLRDGTAVSVVTAMQNHNSRHIGPSIVSDDVHWRKAGVDSAHRLLGYSSAWQAPQAYE